LREDRGQGGLARAAFAHDREFHACLREEKDTTNDLLYLLGQAGFAFANPIRAVASRTITASLHAPEINFNSY
jgi:hypothetical protein